MALSSGTRLGPYEVLSPLGAGGMGEVYRARDSRLKRDVAVKVLPEALSANADALARFEREALAVAALSHPGILSIFDVGESDGVRYAVTELLEGETLRAFAARGALPLKRTLEIVHQLADALAAAHEKGFVHRDVKPENVFVTKDGRAKLLDFGLARAFLSFRDPDDSRSPTVDALTEAGAVVGTVAYMSPEQASGLPVDDRSDQFSLGVVLYELLAGARPFARTTAAETMAAIIRDEPEPLETVAPAVPAPVRWLVERLLHKEAGARYAATRDLAHELASLRAHLSETATAATGVVAAARPRRARLALGAITVVIVTALAAATPFALLLRRERARSRSANARFEVRLPDGYFLESYRNALALSPDGKLLVFAAFTRKKPSQVPGENQLFLRPLDSLESRPIPGTEGALTFAFSPDGRTVAFAGLSERGPFLKKVPVSGGPAQTVCACDASFGITWGADGTILFAKSDGPLQAVPASGGTPEAATELDAAGGEVSHRLPHFLPDGRTFLYTALRWTNIGGSMWKRARIYAERPAGKARSLLVEGGSDGRWASPGVLLFAQDGSIFSAPLDETASKLTGPRIPVLENVRHAIRTEMDGTETGAAHLDVSGQGLLAWGPGSVEPALDFPLLWLDSSGRETVPTGGPIGGPIIAGRVSADGRRILVSYYYPGWEAELLDLDRGGRRRVTFDSSPIWAIWGPGPDRITFTSDREGPTAIYSRRLDAPPGEIETLWKPADTSVGNVGVGSWSPDGKTLAFVRSSPTSPCHIWLLERGKEPRPFLATPFDTMHPDISPDGTWLLYTSTESGHTEVFAKALSGEGGSLQVSTGEGVEALWSRDGTSVYYWRFAEGKPELRALFRVRVTRSAGVPRFGVPEHLLEGTYGIAAPGHSWDVSPAGRFLVNDTAGEAGESARWNQRLSDRIVVDTGGVARLLADAKMGP